MKTHDREFMSDRHARADGGATLKLLAAGMAAPVVLGLAGLGVAKVIVPAANHIGRTRTLSVLREDERITDAFNAVKAEAHARPLSRATRRALDARIGRYCASVALECPAQPDFVGSVRIVRNQAEHAAATAYSRQDRKTVRKGFEAFSRELIETIDGAPTAMKVSQMVTLPASDALRAEITRAQPRQPGTHILA